jgi:crossover junction endodeoxyribonuclease RuvC
VSVMIGIDPGITGAVGLLNGDGSFRAVVDLPVIRDRSLAWIDSAVLSAALAVAISPHDAVVVIERVSAMPGQGVASSFGFGVTLGSILAAVQAMRLPLEFVTPATWKRALALGADKHAALHKARLMYPMAELSLVKHHNRAEALLIAHFAYRRTLREVA